MTRGAKAWGLALAAAACAFGQQAAPPAEPPAAQIKPLKTVAIQPRIGILGQTTMGLREAIERVLANNPDLRIVRIQLEEAGYNIRGALGYYDPVVGLRGYHTRQVAPVASVLAGSPNGKLTSQEFNATPQLTGAFPALGGTYALSFVNSRQTSDNQFNTLNPLYATSVNLNLTQPLWRGLRFDQNRHRVEVARKNRQLSMEQLRLQVIQTVTQAVQAYWELDYARRSLDVQEEAVRLAERQYESNRRQAEQGILAPVDVVAAQTQVAIFQQNLLLAQQQVTQAENNLKTLMLPSRDDLLWGMAIMPETQVNTDVKLPLLDAALKAALSSRPELAEAALNLDINKLDVRLAKDQTRPRVDAFANLTAAGLAGRVIAAGPNPISDGLNALVAYINQLGALSGLSGIPPISLAGGPPPALLVGGYGQSLNNLASGEFPVAQVGVQVSLPIRNRTAEAQAAVSQAEGRKLRVARDQVEMAVEADVRNALQAAISARSRLEAAVLASHSAAEQYDSEQRQFQAGTSTTFLVLQRQTDLINARNREVRSRADLAVSLANLDRATARTIEAYGIKVTP